VGRGFVAMVFCAGVVATGPAAYADSISDDFAIQRVTVNNHKEVRTEWTKASTVAGPTPYYVLIGATWCHFTQALFTEFRKRPALAKKFTIIVFWDDEMPTVERMVKEEYALDEANKYIARLRRLHRKLFDPDVLSAAWPTYVVKPDAVNAVSSGFPTVLKCVSRRCKVAADSLLDEINPILEAEAKRSEGQ